MTFLQRSWPWVTAVAVVAGLGIIALRPGAGPSVALIRVVDGAGQPVVGAVVRPDGLRTKAGPYQSGHYGWRRESMGVPDDPVTTDAAGVARVPYPKYVLERIETGEISFSVRHPEFVPDRPFRQVAARPPAGAPWKAWFDYLLTRVQRRQWIARPEPVVLQRGAVLLLSVRTDSAGPKAAPLFAQAAPDWMGDTNYWQRPEPGVAITRQLAAGPQAVRAVCFDASGGAWFSEVVDIQAAPGRTNGVEVALQPGAMVRGQLDPNVPRPVRDGRVIVQVWPTGRKPEESPPQWHAWAPVREDGSFEVGSLPAGDLEIVALCRGFVSTNGPGQFSLRYPQKHQLGTNDLSLTIGMEPTARLEVLVLDQQGNPVKGARVSTWPNVRYGEWSATILASDCYNTADSLRSPPLAWQERMARGVPDFEGTSDAMGLAVVPNLPADVKTLAIQHPEFTLPVVESPGGGKSRTAGIELVPGETNRVTLRLERTDRTAIRHY